MGVFKEIERADGSGVTTFYRISDVQDTVETDDSEGTATVIDYNQAQNKPSINGVALVGNKTSEDLGLQPAGDYITNDEADAKFIDEDELEAYNYVNETQLQEAIANIDHFHREIVAALPVTGQDNVLYLVRKEGSGEDIYNEYIWVGRSYSEDGYEFIGTTATDLTDYYQKSEVNALLNNKVDKVDGKGLSEQNYTLSEKTKLAGLHNYDDTELQVKVANLHNYDDTDLQLRVGDLEVKEEADINAIQTIQDALDKKMICIRLVEQGDGWTWMDINGSRLTYNKAQAYLGQENCMLFVEQLENDGKVIPAEYKSETTRTRVIFKDLDSLVHILTLGEEDLLVEDTISTEDGLADFEVENEAVDFGARLDEFYGNTSQEVIAAAPSPDRPSEIKVVKGNNNIKVHNKNLFDGVLELGNWNTDNGSKLVNTSFIINSHPISVKELTNYKISLENEDIDMYVFEYKKDMSYNLTARKLVRGDSYLTTEEGTAYINFRPMNQNTNLHARIQVEAGTTRTEYALGRTQIFPLSLGQIELCKIGDYKDKIYKENDKWYLHKEIGKVVLNGSEEWTKSNENPNRIVYRTTNNISDIKTYTASSKAPELLLNYFFPASNNATWKPWDACQELNGKRLTLIVSTSIATTTDLKTWLSSHNTITYYVLETPTNTEITDTTLLTQLENLQQITQYKHTYIDLIPDTDNGIPDAKFTYISNAVINASDKILGKDTYWNDEVPTSADLPSNAEEGEIRIVQDTQNVYIYDGYEWIPFDKGGEVDLSNYLAKDNSTAWVPTGAFNPATKKYVDDSVNGIFVPTKTSQLTNDSNFIGKNSNDLTYYYTKSQTYTKSEVEALIHGGGGGDAGLNGTQLNADCAIDDLINNDTETFYYIGDNEIELTVPIVSDSSHTITMTKDSFILIDRSGVYITLVTGGGGVYVFWKDTDSQNFYNGGYTLTEEDAYFKRDTYSKQEVNAIIGSPEIWNWASTTTTGARADKSKASGIYGNYKSYSLFPTITLNASKYSDEYSGFYYFKSNTVESGAGEIIFSSSNEMDNTELYFTIANNLVSTVGLRPGNSVAGFIPYYDSGYYMTPTRWTVVGELPDYPNSTTLYFVSPDYYEQYINTSVSSTGFNSGVSFSHITNYFLNPDDLNDIKETWQNTAPSGASSGSENTRWLVHAPKYEVAVGATPVFTNTNSEDLHMYGVLEQRNPQTTALIYSAYLNVDANLTSGTMYYYDHDDYHGTGTGVPIPIYIPGSTSFYYTIGTNGGLACLKGDTPIKTSNARTKQIKDLTVGDTVIDAAGNKTKVVKVFSHTVNTTFNITLSNEDVLVASYGHKFSINNHFRRACQVLKDHKLDRQDGSKFDVVATEIKQEEIEVYEILTESGTYTLGNGIICECEAI